MNAMKFSIVTPSFNQVQYLGDCLRSVRGQTYPFIEHIVIDGGSTDGSIDLLHNFQAKDRRLSFITEPDNGQGDAVNKGFGLVTGDIVSWINSDDFYFSPYVFEKVADLFSRHTDADLIYGGMAWVDYEARLLHVRIPPDFDWSRLTRIAYMGNTNVFFWRRVIERHQIDIRFHYVLDHEFLLRVSRDFRPTRTKEILGCFRVQPEAKTQTMAEEKKNVERRLRDEKLGISSHHKNPMIVAWDRLWYRAGLFYSDAVYLHRYKDNPPYQPFLNHSKAR